MRSSIWEVDWRRNKRRNSIAIAAIRSKALLDMNKTAAGGLSFSRQIMSRMSASGTKRTFLFAPRMSAFGGKADMAFCTANVRF